MRGEKHILVLEKDSAERGKQWAVPAVIGSRG